MSVHVCHGEWFKHKISKADHVGDLAITTAVLSKICLAAKRHNFILMCSSLPLAGRTVALITYEEDEGPSHGINSTPLSECRGLVPMLAVTDCWLLLLANGEHDLVSAACKKLEGEAPNPLLCSVVLHLPLEVFIWMWVSHGWKVSG